LYRRISDTFDVGDLFVFYSDGVIEVEGIDGEGFGLERLMHFIEGVSMLAPEEIVESLIGHLREFSGSECFRDDVTCVVIKIMELPPEDLIARESMEIKSDLQELAGVREFTRAACEKALLEGDAITDVILAVNEALTNIVRHAFDPDEDEKINIEFDALMDKVVVRLRHCGRPFRPVQVTLPRVDSYQEGGYGLHIIKESLDKVSYIQESRGRNCVCMEKRRTTQNMKKKN